MEPRGWMPHSQESSNNPYSEPNQPNSSYWVLTYIYSILIDKDLCESRIVSIKFPFDL